MCDSCTSAQAGFAQGATPKDRTLQTSVEQGTSPDWSSADSSNDEHDYRD